jgi:hypothetical protein
MRNRRLGSAAGISQLAARPARTPAIRIGGAPGSRPACRRQHREVGAVLRPLACARNGNRHDGSWKNKLPYVTRRRGAVRAVASGCLAFVNGGRSGSRTTAGAAGARCSSPHRRRLCPRRCARAGAAVEWRERMKPAHAQREGGRPGEALATSASRGEVCSRSFHRRSSPSCCVFSLRPPRAVRLSPARSRRR